MFSAFINYNLFWLIFSNFTVNLLVMNVIIYITNTYYI